MKSIIFAKKRNTNSISFCNQLGFTLIELLIAITILAILSAMAYGGLGSVLKNHEILSAQQESFTQLTQLITQLQKEIRHIVPRPVHDKYSTFIPALKLENGTTVLFSFTRAGIPNPSGRQKNSLQRIDYIFSNKTLKKQIWLTIDRNNSDAYSEEIISSNLDNFKIELLGFDGAVYQQWPLSKTDPIDILPKAIRFTLASKEAGEISRLVELPI
jgi:general secretion pathway protein J